MSDTVFDNIVEKYNVDVTHVTDFSADPFSSGNKHVYAWVNRNGELFYIGKGGIERVINVTQSGRSAEFLEKALRPIKVFLFAQNVSDSVALRIERCLIQAACSFGHRICNKDEMMTVEETEAFENLIQDPASISRFSEHVVRMWTEYCGTKREFSAVVGSFRGLLLDLMLWDKDGEYVSKSEEFARPRTDSEVIPLKSWTIDGVTKPCREWCHEYGMSYACAYKRIKNYGLSPKQALTFPKIGNNKRRAMEQWQAMGLI